MGIRDGELIRSKTVSNEPEFVFATLNKCRELEFFL